MKNELKKLSAARDYLTTPNELDLRKPERRLDSLILSSKAQDEVEQLIEEWTHREVLAKKGLPTRNILLLRGPSGNGKTSLAQAIATSLDLPFGLVSYADLVNSHLGETTKRLTRLMNFATTHQCMLFFDEADAIVTERSSGYSAAALERNMTTNQLLIKLDSFGTLSMAVFATNRNDLLDSAMRRRVHQVIDLEAPGDSERRRMFDLCWTCWPFLEPGWHHEAASAESFAAIEAAAMSAARRIVLAHEKLVAAGV